MNNRTTILNELKELSPILASFNQQMPYQVPEGYFEHLPESLLQLVKDADRSAELEMTRENPYVVPTGYFDQFASTMLKRVKALDAGTAKEEIDSLSPLLQGLQNKTAFQVPEGYFAELTDNAVEGVKAIEEANEALENLSPLMSSLKDANVYEVPENYFEELPSVVLDKARLQQPARVISMRFTRKVIRFAAAAVLIGISFTAVWWMMNDTSNPTEEKIARDIKKIGDKDLLEYQVAEGPVEVITIPGTDEIDATDMKEMLADISDEELQQYTEQMEGNNQSITN